MQHTRTSAGLEHAPEALPQALEDEVGCSLATLGRVVLQIGHHLPHDLAKADRLMRTVRGEDLVIAVDHAPNVDGAVASRLPLRDLGADGTELVAILRHLCLGQDRLGERREKAQPDQTSPVSHPMTHAHRITLQSDASRTASIRLQSRRGGHLTSGPCRWPAPNCAGRRACRERGSPGSGR